MKMVSWWFFLVYMVFSRPVFCDSDVQSALREVSLCLGDRVESCLGDRAIDALLDATHLSDIKNSSKDGRSYHTSVEELLMEKIFQISGLPVSEEIQTGRSRTFNKAWKYLVPFLIGVMLKLATFVPMILTVLTLIAKNALITGNLALLLTGLNIALKYWQWHPKWSESQHSSSSFHDHFGHSDFGHFHGFNHGFGHLSSHQPQEDPHDIGTYGHQSDAPYKTRRIFIKT